MRRTKRHPLRHIGNFVWPEIGLKRWFRYLCLRVSRLPGTPYSIAAGLACGAAISMTPFVGLHFVLAAALAWMIGANIIAGLIGTAVGNPWTFPFIWASVHNVGTWMVDGQAVAGEPAAGQLADMFGHLLTDTLTLNLSGVAENAWPIFWPMLVGSIPSAILIWLVCYFPLRRLISGFQQRRLKRRLKRKAKQAGFTGMEVPNGS
ncbi:MAG: DUF2062 domain-containing protein [Alphaproteobacteria bacterium]|nr:DUF2062 domain-containing protein [Alphaproteobacteria bacterium]